MRRWACSGETNGAWPTSSALDAFQKTSGIDIPVHVDAASGGFVAPFAQPDLEWDFRLPRVVSINASGHKYGLVYPGIGWIVWRDRSFLPDALVFEVNYLGGNEPTFTLNSSRPGAQIVGQYFTFLRLGMEGFRKTHEATIATAGHIASAIADMGPYELLTRGDTIPVFAFTLKERQRYYTLYDVSKILTMHGWQVPAYSFPSNATDLVVMRVCVRNGFSRAMADLLIRDFKKVTDFMNRLKAPLPDQVGSTFAHGGRALVDEKR